MADEPLSTSDRPLAVVGRDENAERDEIAERHEPPVVARLVVEIRSDGTRTIARGALQDASVGQEVAVQAEGTTPLALAFSLVKSMLRAPSLVRAIANRKRVGGDRR
jgi:hypothetical protein